MTPVDWFGLAPVQWERSPGRAFSMALWRFDDDAPQSVRTQPVADAHMVCVHLSGRMDWACEADGRAYRRPALPGTLSIARPGEVADVEWRNAHIEFAHFYIPNLWLEGEVADGNSEGPRARIELIDPMNAHSPSVAALAARAVASMRAGGQAARLEIEATGLWLAASLVRDHSNGTLRTRRRGGLPPAKRRLVIDRLESGFAQDLGLAELAALAGLSQQHFCRAFKETLGVSPHRYLIALRIERGRSLLAETGLSVAEIGAAVGYDDPAYFSRIFRQETGVSPALWRRSL